MQGLRGSRLSFLPSENMAAARNSHKSIGYKWAVSNHSRANFWAIAAYFGNNLESRPQNFSNFCVRDCIVFANFSQKCCSDTPKSLFMKYLLQIQRPEVVVVLQRRNALCFPSWNRNFEWRGAWRRRARCHAPASRKWRRKWRRCSLK